MNKVIDAHCHIGNRATSIQGGAGIVNSVIESDWLRVLGAARRSADIFPALGIHPWHADATTAGWDARLYKLLSDNPSAMVGECGLDRARGDFNAQISVFLTQFDMAAELRRTLHLHCVRASADILHIIKSHPRVPPVIVWHGFAQNVQVLSNILRCDNVMISLGAAALDARHTALMDAIASIPTSRILVESDDVVTPDATKIRQIINTIAKLKNIDNNTLISEIYDNTIRTIRNGQITQN